MPGFVSCGPNEVLVISGCCHSKPYLMPGGRVFVWPWFQMLQKISLNTMTLTIESPDVYTKEGVPISLTGIAQVKVNSNNAEMISLACEHFLCKTEQEIISIVQETMEGHQREVMASMTVESIYRERKQFSKQVYQAASSGLSGMGLTVVSYTVKDIKDDHGYLRSLGESCTASVKKDADVCEAEALKKTQLNQTEAEELKQSSALKNELEIARSQYQFREKKCQYDQEVCEGRATADFAAEMQRMETRNKITMEKLSVQLEESELQVKLAEEEARRARLQMEIEVQKLADAECERMILLADAHKEKIQIEANAEANAILERNKAKAFEIESCGKIEYEMMAKKANAMRDFNSAARMDMILETLPRVAAEIAAPLAQCNKITMISQGEGELGANKLTNEILEIIHKVHHAVEQISSQTDDVEEEEDDEPVPGLIVAAASRPVAPVTSSATMAAAAATSSSATPATIGYLDYRKAARNSSSSSLFGKRD